MSTKTKSKGKQVMAETKEVAVKGNAAVATSGVAQGAWGSEGLDKDDLMLGKVRVMQGLSKLVSAGKAHLGDIVHTVTGEKLGDKNSAVEFIPLATFKTWVISHKFQGEKKFTYIETIPLTAANKHLEMDEVNEDGTEIQRDRVINVYVLLTKELAEGAAIPVVISFQRTSYSAGKKLANHFARMEMMRQPGAAKTLKLACVMKTKDDDNFYVLDVEQGRNTTEEELKVAYDWYQVLSKGQHKVDDSDLKASDGGEATADANAPEQF